MNHPDPNKHQKISFAKSVLRVTGYLALLVNPLAAVAFLVVSEALGILEDGDKCCECLSLSFDEVYKRTNTSYKPIYWTWTDVNGEIRSKWYSDYKSASSVERIEAFMKLGKPDPVEYADEEGPTTWKIVTNHVKQILENHANI